MIFIFNPFNLMVWLVGLGSWASLGFKLDNPEVVNINVNP